MRRLRLYISGLIALILVLAAAGQSARAAADGTGPDVMAVQEKYSERLLSVPEVVGTAAGQDVVIVLATDASVSEVVPDELDGVPVDIRVTGEFKALKTNVETCRSDRPVPIGVATSAVGSDVTGTVACRVTDGAQVYGLSTWHIWGAGSSKPVGTEVVQPGGQSGAGEGVMGTIAGYRDVSFEPGSVNRMDAAVAMTSTEDLGVSTPEDGYGTPQTRVEPASPGQEVEKYGAGTGLTRGRVVGVNAILDVSYGDKTARFVEQILVKGTGTFAEAGDSGALIVTNFGRNPVGLVFAGGRDGEFAVATPIGMTLAAFGVSVDTRKVTDLAVKEMSADIVGDEGTLVKVSACITNLGAREITSDIEVTLKRSGNGILATETISGGLGVRQGARLAFTWEPEDYSGTADLVVSHNVSDDRSENDSATATVQVGPVE